MFEEIDSRKSRLGIENDGKVGIAAGEHVTRLALAIVLVEYLKSL